MVHRYIFSCEFFDGCASVAALREGFEGSCKMDQDDCGGDRRGCGGVSGRVALVSAGDFDMAFGNHTARRPDDMDCFSSGDCQRVCEDGSCVLFGVLLCGRDYGGSV